MRTFLKHMLMSLAFFTAISVSAQPGRDKGPHKVNPELRSYFKDNVMPVLKEQRLKLDQMMSSNDKVTLQKIRSEMESLREAGKSKMMEMKENREQRTPPSPEERAQFRAHRDARTALMDQATDLAFKYHEEIKGLMEEISSEREKWKSELGEMRPERNETPPAEKRHRLNKEMQSPFMKMTRPVGFMLWDPEKERPASEKSIRAKVSPNPGNGMTQIDYQLQDSGQINIILLDNQGNQLKVLTDEFQEAGAHQLQVDTENMAKEIYFVRIITPDGSRTLRVMVE